MSNARLARFRRAAHIAFSRHPVARLHRAWGYFTEDSSGQFAGEVFLLPLTLLMLALFLFAQVPDASDAIAAVCAVACMP